ncbi:MAG: PilZ domain-containing protein [Planctomycetes bacterium]|jgi:hypothetical protein|nr:PilZ domain-containing protein [Planctomycetota bacterium]
MAKQKDHGDLLEIFYDKDRDTLQKFQRILRKVILSEKKDISIYMEDAPSVDRDYLASFVYGAQSLKVLGKTVTFHLSPLNYSILKTSSDAEHFNLKMPQVVDKQKEKPKPVVAKPKITTNIIQLTDDDNYDIISNKIQQILEAGYSEVVVDLRKLFLITPELIQILIVETLNTGNAITVQINQEMEEIFRLNPQAVVINLEIFRNEPEISQGAEFIPGDHLIDGAELIIGERQGAEFIPNKPDPVPVFESILDATPAQEVVPIPVEDEKNLLDVAQIVQDDVEDIPVVDLPERDKFDFDESTSNFEIKVNCLYVNPMEASAFLRDFDAYFQTLCKSAGKKMFIDMREYNNLEKSVAIKLLFAHAQAKEHGTDMTIRLLKDQNKIFQEFVPVVEELEREKDDTPRFIITGSRMELINVDMRLFLETFSEHFKQLMASGHTNLVVDISQLIGFTEKAIDLLVLCYLEAVGRGFSLTLRIAPEMEDGFRRSGRGRSLPLEVVAPQKVNPLDMHIDRGRPRIDMDKIREAMNKDKLTSKVLEHQFETVHIESRGTFQNWEPIMAKEKEVVYTGVERRIDPRYKTENVEVMFARGSLSKIAGRKYPVRNISNTGISFISPTTLGKNEQLRMKVYADELSAELNGRVIWCKPVPSQALFEIGVQYIKLSEVSTIQLKEIIRIVH